MNRHLLLTLVCALALCAGVAHADSTQSYTGTLSSPDNATSTFDSTDSFILSLTLGAASNVTLQTYGFGGGMNGAGMTIAPGGTDPFIGLFAGSGSSASFINGGSLILNYSNGCPPANSVADFGATTCGDETFTFDGLAAGAYTVLLSDGNYIPAAFFDSGTLGEGAIDFTGGVFCNTVDVTTGTPCPNTSGAWALDVTESPVTTTTVPEPISLALLGVGLLVAAGLLKRKRRRA